MSWNALLKMTGLKLEILSYIQMFAFVEKAMQGGISYNTTIKVKKVKIWK